jgi:hypothetical protein
MSGIKGLLLRGLLPWVMVAVVTATTACARFVPAGNTTVPAGAVGTNESPAVVYGRVNAVLAEKGYQIVARDELTRRVRVRTHVDETSAERVTYLDISVEPSGAISIIPSGYLVTAGGAQWHRAVVSEVEALRVRLGGAPSQPNPTGVLPSAYGEVRDDGAVATCVPVAIPRDQSSWLRLVLLSGEELDVGLYVQYAPDFCQSGPQCPIAGGCPALGSANQEQALLLVERIKSGSAGSLATVRLQGRDVARIDLAAQIALRQSVPVTRKK